MPENPSSLAAISKSIGKSNTPIPENTDKSLSSLGLRTHTRSSSLAGNPFSSASPPPPSPSPGSPLPNSMQSASLVSSNVLLSNILMRSVTTARTPHSNTLTHSSPLRPRQRTSATTILSPVPVSANPVSTDQIEATFQAPMVFLGGSCHPTTWRQTEAIPLLSQAGVSYFNPQIDNWSEAFMVLENIAKEGAEVLLFTIDPLTRAMASMLEATELIARGRNVVLIIENVAAGTTIGDQVITGRELSDLNRARHFLKDLGLRNPRNCRVFDSVKEGIQHIIDKYSDDGRISPPYVESCPSRTASRNEAFIVQQNYDEVLSVSQQESFQKQLNKIIHESG